MSIVKVDNSVMMAASIDYSFYFYIIFIFIGRNACVSFAGEFKINFGYSYGILWRSNRSVGWRWKMDSISIIYRRNLNKRPATTLKLWYFWIHIIMLETTYLWIHQNKTNVKSSHWSHVLRQIHSEILRYVILCEKEYPK